MAQTAFGAEARDRVRNRLRSWPEIDRKVQHLQRLIEQDREALQRLDDQIHSTMTPNYENMDMPRNPKVHDKVGDMVARIIDKRNELHFSILTKEIELYELERSLQEIETAVGELDPFFAEIVKRYFFYKERWESICVRMKIGRSRFYEILTEALDILGNQL